MSRLLLAVWLGSLGIVAPAQAAAITYGFQATVADIPSGEAGPSVLPPQVGDRIAITLTLDSAIADTDPSAHVGSYDNLRDASLLPSLVLNLDIGGTGGDAMFQRMTILNDVNGVDSIYIQTSQVLIGVQAELLFQTTDLSILASDAIPATIDPADFEIATFVRRIYLDRDYAAGTIDSRAAPIAVPEPTSAAVLLASLGLILRGVVMHVEVRHEAHRCRLCGSCRDAGRRRARPGSTLHL